MSRCTVCECVLTRATRCKDPEFCKSCYDEIERMTQNPMPHVRAARCYMNTYPRDKRLEIFAFLSIFHPTMPVRRRHELANSVW
jgi:hypothetical protein